jgi:sugar O-acyltransferase (sialic acid O-acetyltransferase NeuD family)
MSDIYAVYGSGGYAREVIPLLRDYVNAKSKQKNNQFVFIDDSAEYEEMSNGILVLNFKMLIQKFSGLNIKCCIAIADKTVRERLTLKCMQSGISMMTVKSMNSVVMDEVTIGEGSVLSPFVTITSNVCIGKSFHANIYSYVAHDCVIGDFVTFAPAVKCNGNVHIKNGAYIGTGAIIHPGTKNNPIVIGKNSKVGAGAVVTKSVPDNVTVIGSPAKILTRQFLKKMKADD